MAETQTPEQASTVLTVVKSGILLVFVGSQKATEMAIVLIQTFLSMQIVLVFQRLFVSIATEEGILPVCADRRERVPPAEDALPSNVLTDSIRVQPERQ